MVSFIHCFRRLDSLHILLNGNHQLVSLGQSLYGSKKELLKSTLRHQLACRGPVMARSASYQVTDMSLSLTVRHCSLYYNRRNWALCQLQVLYTTKTKCWLLDRQTTAIIWSLSTSSQHCMLCATCCCRWRCLSWLSCLRLIFSSMTTSGCFEYT